MSGRFAVDTVAVDTLKHLALPSGPWSYRVFLAEGRRSNSAAACRPITPSRSS